MDSARPTRYVPRPPPTRAPLTLGIVAEMRRRRCPQPIPRRPSLTPPPPTPPHVSGARGRQLHPRGDVHEARRRQGRGHQVPRRPIEALHNAMRQG